LTRAFVRRVHRAILRDRIGLEKRSDVGLWSWQFASDDDKEDRHKKRKTKNWKPKHPTEGGEEIPR